MNTQTGDAHGPLACDGTRGWIETAEDCLNMCSLRLTEWERDFLSDMVSRNWEFRKPTDKQVAIINRIFRKCGV
jgi:hypothetical protein